MQAFCSAPAGHPVADWQAGCLENVKTGCRLWAVLVLAGGGGCGWAGERGGALPSALPARQASRSTARAQSWRGGGGGGGARGQGRCVLGVKELLPPLMLRELLHTQDAAPLISSAASATQSRRRLVIDSPFFFHIRVQPVGTIQHLSQRVLYPIPRPPQPAGAAKHVFSRIFYPLPLRSLLALFWPPACLIESPVSFIFLHILPGSLLALYRDIEITDRHNTFYEKFSTRYQVGPVWQLLFRVALLTHAPARSAMRRAALTGPEMPLLSGALRRLWSARSRGKGGPGCVLEQRGGCAWGRRPARDHPPVPSPPPAPAPFFLFSDWRDSVLPVEPAAGEGAACFFYC